MEFRKGFLFMIAMVLAAGPWATGPLAAATIDVDSTVDNLTAGDGACSLREALLNANADSDTTGGDCTAGDGADTIAVPAGIYILTVTGTGEDSGATGDLDFTDGDLTTITGAGARSTIVDANAIDRVFHSVAGSNAEINDMTIRNGAEDFGAGIRVDAPSNLTINASRLTGNVAGNDGGGMAVTGSATAVVTINRSLIDNNTAIPDSTASGGGISVALGGTLVVNQSTITGNSARAGGALLTQFNGGGSVVLNHTTVTGNSDLSGFGGIRNNFSGSVTLRNSIVSGNAGSDCSDNAGGGPIVSDGFNIIGSRGTAKGCPSGGTGDQILAGLVGTLLDTLLSDHGGPTDTHALVSGSSALDQIAPATSGCGTANVVDQRGVARPNGAGCDIGAFEVGTSLPELSVTTNIPAAEQEAVAVPVHLATNGSSIAATTFSIDYDASCLSFDDTDGDLDGVPDALAFSLPAGFSVAAFHDLGDSDGEIDISIFDLAPPIATLVDGSIVTATFTATCSPALGATVTAPVGFSSDPSATFSSDLAVDINGTTSDGSVVIYPGPRGDCNGNGALSAADLIASALEIFDGDGTFWVDVVGGSFLGSPVGCDANGDTQVNAGDISCTILRIFGATCAPGPGAGPGVQPGGGLDPDTAPVLGLTGRAIPGNRGTVWIPVHFSAGAHAVSSAVFSLDLADRGLVFDPSDGDGDGLPDAVRFPQGRPDLADVRFDATDRGGELDVVLANFASVLDQGVLIEVAVQPLGRGKLHRPLRFAAAPAASFGDLSGGSVGGLTIDTAVHE